MKKIIFREAFKKAENQCGNCTKHGLSSHLEKVFTNDLKFSINKITFVRYYEKYIDNDKKNTSNPSSDLLNKVSEYLGYINYEDFVTKNCKEEISNTDEKFNSINVFKSFLKKYNVTIIVSCLLIIGFAVYFSKNKQRWMVWNGNQYVEVKFDAEKYNSGQLKLYSEEKIINFKKIPFNYKTDFFYSNEHRKIWYGQNRKKEVEYFTALGLHPETGKMLYPVTESMINKYIDSSYIKR